MTQKENIDDELINIFQVLGNPKSKPPIKPIIPVSKSSFYVGIKNGIYPKPIKLGKNSFWSKAEIYAAIEARKQARRLAA
jgi:predicted DNA-binding transcriptional regulator AlpA